MSLIFRCATGVVATFLTLHFVACASDQTTSAFATASSPDATSPSTGASGSDATANITSVEVGPDGKTFETESGMTVTIPPGALPAGTTITVKSGDETAPTGYQAETGVFRFGPDGLVFATPITVSLPSTSTTGAVYWSRQGDPSMYDVLPTTFENGHATAHPIHFSSAFVGTAAAPVAASDGGDDTGSTSTDPGGGPAATPQDGGTTTADAGTAPSP